MAQPNGATLQSWQEDILKNTEVISTALEGKMVVEQLMKGFPNQLEDTSVWPFTEGKPAVAVDCEGINLGLKGTLCLVQVATMDGNCYIFDVFSCPDLIESGLRWLLETPAVIKIIHASRNDVANFRTQFRLNIRTIFDTQVAYEILAYQRKGWTTSEEQNIGLNKLCRMKGIRMDKSKKNMKKIYRVNPNYWATRPLTQEMIVYAATDALNLIDRRIYPSMANKVAIHNRQYLYDVQKSKPTNV